MSEINGILPPCSNYTFEPSLLGTASFGCSYKVETLPL